MSDVLGLLGLGHPGGKRDRRSRRSADRVARGQVRARGGGGGREPRALEKVVRLAEGRGVPRVTGPQRGGDRPAARPASGDGGGCARPGTRRVAFAPPGMSQQLGWRIEWSRRKSRISPKNSGSAADQLLTLLRDMGVSARSPSASLEDTQVSAVRVRWEREKRRQAEAPATKKPVRKKAAAKVAAPEPEPPAADAGRPARRRRTAAEVAEAQATADAEAARVAAEEAFTMERDKPTPVFAPDPMITTPMPTIEERARAIFRDLPPLPAGNRNRNGAKPRRSKSRRHLPPSRDPRNPSSGAARRARRGTGRATGPEAVRAAAGAASRAERDRSQARFLQLQSRRPAVRSVPSGSGRARWSASSRRSRWPTERPRRSSRRSRKTGRTWGSRRSWWSAPRRARLAAGAELRSRRPEGRRTPQGQEGHAGPTWIRKRCARTSSRRCRHARPRGPQAPERRAVVPRAARGPRRRRGRAGKDPDPRQRVHLGRRAGRHHEGSGHPDRPVRVQGTGPDGHREPAARLRPDRADLERLRLRGRARERVHGRAPTHRSRSKTEDRRRRVRRSSPSWVTSTTARPRCSTTSGRRTSSPAKRAASRSTSAPTT